VGASADSDGQPAGIRAGSSIASDAIGISASLASIGSAAEQDTGPTAVEEGIGEGACLSWTSAQAATSDLLALRVAMREETEARKDRKAFRHELAQIKEELEELLATNEGKPEIEKLEREEFVIDEEGKVEVESRFQLQAEERKQQLQSMIDAVSLEAARVKEEGFDSMEEPFWAVHGLKSATTVESMPICKVTPDEARQLDRVTTMRRVEQEELRWHELQADGRGSFSDGSGAQLSAQMVPGGRGSRVWPDIASLFPANIDWVFDCGLLAPTLRPVLQMKGMLEQRLSRGTGASSLPSSPGGRTEPDEDLLAGSSKVDEIDDRFAGVGAGHSSGDGDDDGNGDGDGDAEDRAAPVGEATKWEGEGLVKLLYHPSAVRMPGQKRAQILLLRELVRAVQRTFNQRLQGVRVRKAEEIKRIREKSARMRKIMEAENFPGDVFEPTLLPVEIPDSAF